MKKLVLILLLPLCIISCPKEEIEPDGQGDVLAEADIGPEGAVLKAKGISISVPPGAFDDHYQVQISSEQEFATDFGENAVTPVFRVSGIPSTTFEPISVHVEREAGSGEDSYLAWGNLDEIVEAEEELSSYALYPASDSSGFLTGFIPPQAGEEPESGLKGAGHRKSSYYFSGLARVLGGVSYMKSRKGIHFDYVYPSNTNPDRIAELIQFMEEATLQYFDLGLANREGIEAGMTLAGKPRVVVTNKKKAGEVIYGLRMPHLGPLTNESDGMENIARYSLFKDIRINLSKSELEQVGTETLKSMAYIWIYRMFYYLYWGDQMDWYAYSSALYMQEKFTGVSAYEVNDFSFVGRSPFMGMEAGTSEYPVSPKLHSVLGGQITTQEKMHALGMYPFIKYLDRRYPDDKNLWTRIIMEKVKSEFHTSTEGIIAALEEPEYQWWPSFFEEYLTGQLIQVEADEFLKLFPGEDYQVDFFAEKDTSRFNEDDYPDLSARLYTVNFLFPSFEKEASLNLKVGPDMEDFDYVTTLAFGLKDQSLDYFDRSADLTISNLKTLKESGYSSIPAVVVNSGNGPPGEARQHIELESILKTAPQVFTGVDVTVICRTNYNDLNGDTHETYFNYYIADPPYPGETYQHKFTASWDDVNGDWEYSGQIEVEFDPDQYPDFISSFTLWDLRKASYSDGFTIAGENITLKEYNFSFSNQHYYKFSVSGTEVCNYITQVKQVTTSSSGDVTHDGTGEPICNDQSIFEIILYCN